MSTKEMNFDKTSLIDMQEQVVGAGSTDGDTPTQMFVDQSGGASSASTASIAYLRACTIMELSAAEGPL